MVSFGFLRSIFCLWPRQRCSGVSATEAEALAAWPGGWYRVRLCGSAPCRVTMPHRAPCRLRARTCCAVFVPTWPDHAVPTQARPVATGTTLTVFVPGRASAVPGRPCPGLAQKAPAQCPGLNRSAVELAATHGLTAWSRLPSPLVATVAAVGKTRPEHACVMCYA